MLRSELLRRVALVVALGLTVCSANVSEAAEMNPAFTYQGHLYDTNSVADGLYDFQFKLWRDPCSSEYFYKIGDDVNKPDVDVIDGYFTVELDFNSPWAFDGTARWLEIGVRPGDLNDPNVYTVLSPRQEVTPTPYAIYAQSAAGTIGGSGTLNYIPKFTGTNALGDSVIFETGSKIGIGTTNPQNKLDIEGAAAIGATYSGTNTAPANGMIIEGDVGIGTMGPATKLDVDGVITSTGGNSSNWNTAYGWGDHDLAGYLTSFSETDPQVGAISNNYVPKWDGSALVSGTIYDNGNVGIGTTNPQNNLDVEGAVAVGATYSGTNAAPTNGMIIEGSVGIGTTSPQNKLDVDGAAAIGAAYSGTKTAPENGMIIEGYVGIGVAAPNFIDFRLTLDNDGGILAKGTRGSGANLLVSGAGTRLIWYPKKAAFRAGYVSGNQWDDSNIGDHSTAMGHDAEASDSYTTVGGGFSNTANGYVATVSGGGENTASGSGSTVGGGKDNTAGSAMYTTVSGGKDNTASSSYATVPGGYQNTANGYSSFAAGSHAKAYHDGSFVWGDDTDANFASTGSDQFLIRASGGVGIGTTSPQGALDVNGPIYQRGGLLHADYVFEQGYELESIDEHSEYMWSNKHLAAIPKVKTDETGREIIEVGAHRRGIVEELEKAHIYIEQLHNRIKALQEKDAEIAVQQRQIKALHKEVTELKRLVNKLVK